MKAARRLIFCGCVLALVSVGFAEKGKGKAGDPAKGKSLFEQCAVCHNASNVEKKVGPGMKGLFHRAKLANGKKMTDDNVLARINTGGEGMPAYKDMLSDSEKNDLLAYLKTL